MTGETKKEESEGKEGKNETKVGEKYEPNWEDVEGREAEKDANMDGGDANEDQGEEPNEDNEEEHNEDESKENNEGKKTDEENDDDEHDAFEQLEEITVPDFNVEETLKSTIKLSDGTEAPMFSRGPKYTEVVWPFNCHLCSIPNLSGAHQFREHVNGILHTTKLTEEPPEAEKYRKPLIQNYSISYKNPIKIYPGEIITKITPEYYDRVQKISEFVFKPEPTKDDLELLSKEPLHEYNKKAPIIGLSYAFKYRYYNNVEYFCGLCKIKRGDDVYSHFIGKNHQMEYIQRKFPQLYKKVSAGLDSIKDSQLKKKYVCDIFRKIYRKFEELKGVRKINFVQGKDFKANTRRYLQRVRKNLHYNEKILEIAEEEINEMIEKCKAGEAIIEPDPDSLPGIEKNPRDEDRKSRKRGPSPRRRRGVSPPRKSFREEKSLDDTPQNWDRYRRMLGAALDDLDEMYEEYDRIPEKHPLYEREWKKFWRRRSRELERDNIDPNDYDFKPEWLDFFAELMKELHDKTVARYKFEIKRSLRLPYNARSPSPIRRRKPRSRSRARRRSPTPETSYRDRRRKFSNRRDYSDRRRHEEFEEAPIVQDPREPLSVISVLRLLTALEDQLGSLGPKALEYLSKAILFQKENDAPAEELMMDKEYYIFFVTVKEKLKGQLIANIVDAHKIKAVNNAINDLENILEMFDDYMKLQPERSSFSTGPPVHFGGSSGSENRFSGGSGPPRNVFDNNDGQGNRFGNREGPRNSFGSNEGPRSQFNEGSRNQFIEGLRNQFGGNNPPHIQFDNSDGPRGHIGDSRNQFNTKDGPINQFSGNDGPRSQFRENDGPRPHFDNDGSRAQFRRNDGPGNMYGDGNSRNQFGRNDGPRGQFTGNDGPRGQFTGNEGPRGQFTGNEGLRGQFTSNDGPRGQFTGNDGQCNKFNLNDAPRNQFNTNEGMRNQFSDSRPPQGFQNNDNQRNPFKGSDSFRQPFTSDLGSQTRPTDNSRNSFNNSGPGGGFKGSDGPRNQFGPVDNRNNNRNPSQASSYTGGNINAPPQFPDSAKPIGPRGSQPNQYSGGNQGGIWQSGTNQSFRSGNNFNSSYGGAPQGFQTSNFGNTGRNPSLGPGDSGMLSKSAGGTGGFGTGFRGNDNRPNMMDNSYRRGVNNRGFN